MYNHQIRIIAALICIDNHQAGHQYGEVMRVTVFPDLLAVDPAGRMKKNDFAHGPLATMGWLLGILRLCHVSIEKTMFTFVFISFSYDMSSGKLT